MMGGFIYVNKLQAQYIQPTDASKTGAGRCGTYNTRATTDTKNYLRIIRTINRGTTRYNSTFASDIAEYIYTRVK